MGVIPSVGADIRPLTCGKSDIWIVLYGFVGTQLGWTLRPFFGDPGQRFALFRRIEGNFYVNVLDSFFSIFR